MQLFHTRWGGSILKALTPHCALPTSTFLSDVINGRGRQIYIAEQWGDINYANLGMYFAVVCMASHVDMTKLK